MSSNIHKFHNLIISLVLFPILFVRLFLQAAVDECHACSVDSDDVGLCKYLLAGSEKAFLSKAHLLFLFLGRSDRVTDITMAMKDLFFANAGDMFALPYFPGLRKVCACV